MNNLELWDSVCKTNPADTKKITFGRAITAIDPYKQVRSATEAFGPAGKGWGWSVQRVEYLPTNEMGVLIKLWHGELHNSIEQWGQSSLYIDNAERKKDTDCFKKATTDGVTKCLSYLGFNADIFLGKFDDNKYIQERVNEESYNAVYKEALSRNFASMEVVTNSLDAGNLSAAAEAWYEMTQEDQQALWIAPSKGGCLTTDNRIVMQTSEFREAYYGPSVDGQQ